MKPKRIWALAVLIVAAVAVYAGVQWAPGSLDNPVAGEAFQLRIVMLDVGQGDSILISSGSEHLLVDAGENDKGDEVVAYLKRFGVTRLSAVVGTHPHSDHIGGLDYVIREVSVGAVYIPRLEANSETYEDVLDAAEDRGLSIIAPKPGDTYKLGQADIRFLWPEVDYESGDANNHSIVMLVSAGGKRALLCGDIGKKAEKALLELHPDLRCDVLKVAHHGSDTSSTKDFLKAARPGAALISLGEDNQFKHPDKDVLQRLKDIGAAVYRTDLNGTVTVTVSGGHLDIQTGK